RDYRPRARERVFLTTSRQREVRELTARRRRTRWAVSVLSAVVVVVTALAAVSVLEPRRAASERALAFSDSLVANAREQLPLNPELSLLLARRAMVVRRTVAAEA